MEPQTVFENDQELNRLAIQNRLLRECEGPVLERILAGRSHLRLLDIGCNNGCKTVDRFDLPAVERVVGLEYHGALARRAQAQYGGERFSFRPCNVESPDFHREMERIMAEEGIERFDIIYASFVLLHLERPQAVLASLQPYLAPGGVLLVEEADDEACGLHPDPGGLFRQFLRMLAEDPYAGDRRCGRQVAGWLRACGYREVRELLGHTVAAGEQLEKKRDLFETFFSYLPQDMAELCREEPGNEGYAACAAWLDAHYDQLRAAALSDAAELTLAVRIVTCAGGGEGT